MVVRGHFGSSHFGSSGLGADPLFLCVLPLPFGMEGSTYSSADRCFLIAGQVVKLWKRHRRDIPSDVKDALALLLLELRIHLMPAEQLDCSSNLGRARCDIRGISELLLSVATRGPSCMKANDSLPPTVDTPDPWQSGIDPWTVAPRCVSAPSTVAAPAGDPWADYKGSVRSMPSGSLVLKTTGAVKTDFEDLMPTTKEESRLPSGSQSQCSCI